MSAGADAGSRRDVQANRPAPVPCGRWAAPDRIWVPALAAGVLAAAFVAILVVRAAGDPSLLVHAGPPCTTERARPASPSCNAEVRERLTDGSHRRGPGARGSLTVQPADEAFDGQFFYRLGVAPWSADDRVAGVQFDLPSLRNARWGYGALAYVASGGDADRVPWALIGLNVVAGAAVGAIGGGLARSSGRHAAWGLLLALWPGFAYSASLDTSELVAAAFLLGGLLALRHRRWAVAAIALAAAVLTRDTTAAVPFGVAVAGAWTWWHGPRRTTGSPDRTRRGAGGSGEATATTTVAVAALAVFAGWQLVQQIRFATWPLTSSGGNNLTAPLSGLVTELGHDLPPAGGEEAFRLLCIVGLMALLAAAAWCWRSSAAPVAERIAWLPAIGVVALLDAYLWSGATAFLRAATEAGLLAILVVLGSSRERLVAVTGAAMAGFWVLTAAVQVAKLG